MEGREAGRVRRVSRDCGECWPRCGDQGEYGELCWADRWSRAVTAVPAVVGPAPSTATSTASSTGHQAGHLVGSGGKQDRNNILPIFVFVTGRARQAAARVSRHFRRTADSKLERR